MPSRSKLQRLRENRDAIAHAERLVNEDDRLPAQSAKSSARPSLRDRPIHHVVTNRDPEARGQRFQGLGELGRLQPRESTPPRAPPRVDLVSPGYRLDWGRGPNRQ